MSTERIAIWVRCNDVAKLPLLLELEESLQNDGYPVWFEVTLPVASGNSMAHPTRPRDVDAFVEELSPSILLWISGQFEPHTLSLAFSKGIDVVAADAGIAMLPRMGRGWFPGKTRALLSQFTKVFARTTESADGLIRAGVREDKIVASGALEETGRVLPYDEDVRHDLARQLGPRPIWLAACVEGDEFDAVIRAQREAARRAHRLLCIVMPHGDPAVAAKHFHQSGLVVTEEARGETPSEATQVHIADGAEDGGLWYRLSPITYVGGSLSGGARVDPFHIGTVGSVVVHGKDFGAHGTHFEQMIEANASVVCDNEADIGAAVSALLSAERAARYAQAAWDVTSRGAEVLNLVTDALRAILDKRAKTDA